METSSLQDILFDKIKELLPANTSLVNELADIFDLSIDSAYRRIRGETALNIYEVATLCSHYKISFDSLHDYHSGSVTFKYNFLKNNELGFKGYLQNVYDDLKKIHDTKNSHIVFAAEDIPIFHHFKFPELSAFKMFYWMKSVMNVERYENEVFSPDIIDKEIKELAEKIYNLYSKTPSTEIWTELTIHSLLKQIEFYWESGYFATEEDALLLCGQVKMELENIQKQASLSSKITDDTIANYENNYMLYISDIELGNNSILVRLGEAKMVYLIHYTFNSLITGNNTFSEETETWLNTIIKKSTLISGVSEKQRFQFFKKANTIVNKLIEKIKG